MATVDVLLPTYNRRESLLMVLAGLAGQSFSGLRVVVADQSDEPVERSEVARAMERVIRARGGAVEWHHREELLGIAEQRDFLLKKATAPYVLYLDDDVSWSRGYWSASSASSRRRAAGSSGLSPLA